MGIFDYYVPRPPLTCPRCGVTIDEWQGKSGPNELLEWVQGLPAPVRQRVDEEWALSEAQREQLRLPETFEIHTSCENCRTWIEAEGACREGVWAGVNLVDPLEPPGLPNGWGAVRGDDRAHIVQELHREMPPGHVLKQARLTPLARRRSRDDVLVRAVWAPFPLYLVHLTWREEDDAWPTVQPFLTVAEFFAEEED